MTQEACNPLGRPGAHRILINPGERLERDRAVGAEVVMLAAEAQYRGPRRSAFIEDEDTRPGIAPKLQRKHREQYRLPGPRRSHDQGVADVADMGHQPKGR